MGKLFPQSGHAKFRSSPPSPPSWPSVLPAPVPPPESNLRKELMEHCAICRSWFPNENYVKVRYARVHQDEWRAHHARIRVWCVTNLPKVKGLCSWCGHKAQQGRDHRATCPALFQLAMLWFIDGGPPRDDSNMPTTDVPYPAPADLEGFRDTCQLCATSLAKQRYRTHMQKQHKQLWHDLFPQVQMLCAAWEGSVHSFRASCVVPRPVRRQSMCTLVFHCYNMPCIVASGPGMTDGEISACFQHCLPALAAAAGEKAEPSPSMDLDSDQNKKRPRQEPQLNGRRPPQWGRGGGKGHGGRQQQGRHNREQQELEQIVGTLCRLTLRQEEELQLLRTEKQFLLHMESANHGMLATFWQIAQAWKALSKTPPTGHANPLHDAGVEAETDHHDTERGDSQGASQTRTGQSRRWRHSMVLPNLESDHPKAKNRSAEAAAHQHGSDPDGHGAERHGPKGSREPDSSVPLHPQADREGSGRHDAVHSGSGDARPRCEQGLRDTPRVGGECIVAGDRSQAAQRTGSAAAASTTTPKADGRHAPLKIAEVLKANFPNGDRFSYMHASTVAWIAAGADHFSISQMAGRLAQAFKSFLTVGPAFRLTTSLPWRPILGNWDLKQPPDVPLWMQHVMPQALAPALDGWWEARVMTEGPMRVLAAGPLAPLSLSASQFGFTLIDCHSS